MKEVELKKYTFRHGGMSRLKAVSCNFLPSRIHWREQTQLFLKNNSTLGRKLQIRIFKEDIKLVVVAKPGLETREVSILKLVFDIFGHIWSEIHRMEWKG